MNLGLLVASEGSDHDHEFDEGFSEERFVDGFAPEEFVAWVRDGRATAGGAALRKKR